MLVPHATQIATKGFLGVTIGTVSKGFLIRIVEVAVPPKRTTGPARRGFREEEKEPQKEIKVTVFAYGKKWETTQVVSSNVKIGIEDVEVIDRGEGTIEVSIRNIE